MNARATIASVALLAALTLTGCAAPTASGGNDRSTTVTSESSETTAPSKQELTEQEEWFVGKETWEPFGLTDAELLDAASLACDEFAAGKDGDTMTLPGIPEDLTRYFANSAREEFCPADAG